MSAQSHQPQPGQQPLPAAGLTLNLASNNPFRNLSTSPVNGAFASKPATPSSPFDDPIPPRPVSRNPFLDPFATRAPAPLPSPGAMSTQSDKGPAREPTAEEIFDSLTIEDKNKPVSNADDKRPLNRPPGPPGPMRGGPMMRGRARGGPHHRPTRSQEEAMRAKRMNQPGGPRPGGPSTSPHRRMERRPRRNSDTSLLDSDKPMTEEELKARDARRREREQRSKDGKDKKPNKKLDIIDQLDATNIFGIGAFHHDGPFDACNPHRNRKGSRRAPMKAFADDSLNNAIGGSGPLRDRPDQATLMGNRNLEAFKDFSGRADTSGAPDSNIRNKNGYNLPNPSRGDLPLFDPLARGSIMYGDESLGLGTTTFLEGAPAALSAIQRRQQEQAQDTMGDGLQRKKSLAQRIRSINRGPHPSGRLTNPEGIYTKRSPEPMPPATSMAAIGAAGKKQETNPFFSEYNNEPETLSVKRPSTADKARPPPVMSPTAGMRSPTGGPPSVSRTRGFSVGLERRSTADAAVAAGSSSSPDDGQNKIGRGILGRVKSLKGSRKAKHVSGDASAAPPPVMPGAAI